METVDIHVDLLDLVRAHSAIRRGELQLAHRVVVRANRIVIDGVMVEPDVIVVRADGHVFAAQLGVAARQNRNDVARGRGRLGERHGAAHGLPERPGLHTVRGRAEQGSGTGVADVDVRGQFGRIGRQRRGVLQNRLRLPEEIERRGRKRFERDDRDAGRAAEARQDLRAIHLLRRRDVRVGVRTEDDEFSGSLLRVDHRRVGPHTAVDDLRTVEAPRRHARIARDELFPWPEGRAFHRKGRARIELTLDERYVLEIAARVTGGLKSHPLDFRCDIRRGLEVVLAAGEAAHHGIVGIEIQAGHEICRSDCSLCTRRRVLER